MEEILSKARYESTLDSVRWWRVGLAAGSTFGILAGLVVAVGILPTPTISTQLARLRASLAVVLIGGLLFGILFTSGLRANFRKVALATYLGSGRFAVAPPNGSAYSHRLPCSWKRSRSFAVGGVLFVGPGAMAFVPHSVNLPRDRTPIILAARSLTAIETVPQMLNPLQRFFYPLAEEALEVKSSAGRWEFLVPSPDEVVKAVRAVYAG